MSFFHHRIAPLLKGTHGQTVLRSAGLLTIRLGGAAANFFFVLLLARLMPAQEVGLVLTLTSLAFMFSILLTLNLENVAVRYLLQPLERGDEAAASAFVRFSRTISLLLCAPVLLVFFCVAVSLQSWNWSSAISITFAALSIPALAWLRVGSRYGQALNQVMLGAFSWGLLRPLLLLAMVCAIIFIQTEYRVDFVLAGFALSAFVALGVQAILLRPHLAFSKTTPQRDAPHAEWVKAGLYLAASVLLLDYFQNIVLVAAAPVLDEADLARLGVALRFIALLRMGQMTVNMAMGQNVSRHYTLGEASAMYRMIRFANHLKFWPTLLLYVIVFSLAEALLSIFGQEYVSAVWCLRILALLPLSTALWGTSLLMLNIAGENKAILLPSIVSTFAMFIAIPLGALSGGLNGAAWATVCVVLGFDIWLFIVARQKTGIAFSMWDCLRPAPKTLPSIK